MVERELNGLEHTGSWGIRWCIAFKSRKAGEYYILAHRIVCIGWSEPVARRRGGQARQVRGTELGAAAAGHFAGMETTDSHGSSKHLFIYVKM
jgi:hypothetical protein